MDFHPTCMCVTCAAKDRSFGDRHKACPKMLFKIIIDTPHVQ